MRNEGARRREANVAVNQDVVRALLKARGWTIAELARRTNELEQTLAHLLNRPGARCRKSRRARIAKALQVPQQLLAGGSFPIPLGFMVPDGFEFRYSADTQLAASRFITRVRTAVHRDLRIKPIEGLQSAGVVEDAVLSIFSEFMMFREWRKRFIEWNPRELEQRGYSEPATIRPWNASVRVTETDATGRMYWEASPPRPERDEDHEKAILAVIRGMEHVFEPWFEGKARLNYRAIRDFVHLPAHPFAAFNETTDALSPIAILSPTDTLSGAAGDETILTKLRGRVV